MNKPTMQNIEALMKHNVVVFRCMNEYRAGNLTKEEALMQMVLTLSVVNERLSDDLVRFINTSTTVQGLIERENETGKPKSNINYQFFSGGPDK